MSLNRSTWRWNLQQNLLISPKLQQDYHARKVLTPRLGVNVEATKEKRKVKMGDEVRYHERICKITYIQADGSVNLTAFKGAPFNSKFTPIADLEFPNEDGVFGEVEAIDLDIQPTVIVAPVKPAVRKLLIRPDETVVIFDYATLTVEARVVVQQKTGEIRDHIDTMKRSAIAIGQRLIEVKAQLNHGQWGAWLRTEFNWSDQTALNYMNEARLAGQIPNYLESEDRFNQTALAALAAKSTPRAAQEAALVIAEALPVGEKLTLPEVKEIIAETKAAAHELTVTPTGAVVDGDGEILNRGVPLTRPVSNSKPSRNPDAVQDVIAKFYPVTLEAIQTVIQAALDNSINLKELAELVDYVRHLPIEIVDEGSNEELA